MARLNELLGLSVHLKGKLASRVSISGMITRYEGGKSCLILRIKM